MNDAYGDELAIVPYVKNETVMIALITHKCRGSQQLSRVKYSTQIY